MTTTETTDWQVGQRVRVLPTAPGDAAFQGAEGFIRQVSSSQGGHPRLAVFLDTNFDPDGWGCIYWFDPHELAPPTTTTTTTGA